MDWTILASWMETTWLHRKIVDTFWLMPTMETIHFIGLSILFGALLIVDLRVIGVAKVVNMNLAMKFIPIAIFGFLLNLLSGIGFLFANPFRYFPNISFQWKMGLIFIAGVNALWFWLGEHKGLCRLADGKDAEFRAKVVAALSLAIWVGVIVSGRMMPFVEY